MLLIAIAFPHWSRLWWQGAFLGALGLAELAWSMAWLRKPSFALIWSGYLLGAYLVPIWSLAWDPGGRRLALGLADGGLVIWNLPEVRAHLARLGLDW